MKKRTSKNKNLSKAAYLSLMMGAFALPVLHVTHADALTNTVNDYKQYSGLISGANNQSYAIGPDKSIWAWGEGSNLLSTETWDKKLPIKLSVTSNFVAMDSNFNRSVALKSDGTVWAWGDSPIGDGSSNAAYTPVQVTGLTNVTTVKTGWNTSYALKSDGTVWAWGIGSVGQFGDGTTASRLTATQISGLTGVIAISADYYNLVVVKSDGTVWMNGFNDNDQIPGQSAYTVPTLSKITGLTGVVAVETSGLSTLVLKSDGTVWGFGVNASYALGNGASMGAIVTTPIKVNGLANIVGIEASGSGASYAVQSDGSLWVWGDNRDGQLGDGTKTTKSTPVKSSLTNVLAVKTGGLTNTQALVLKSDGTLWAMGNNAGGQLGDDTKTTSVTPIQVRIPGLGSGLTISPSTTRPTNQNVTISISYPTGSTLKEYKVGSGNWTTYTGPFVVTDNATVDARSTDASSNVTTATWVVNNIDRVAPTAPTLASSVTTPAKTVSVTVTYPADAAVKEYRIDGGAWTAYTAAVAMTANGTIEARATDAAGNVSTNGSLVVSNIDNIPPIAPTLSPSTTTITNQNVNVTITYPADASVKQYRVDGGAWTAYTAAVAMTANGTIEAQATDSVGNVSTIASLSVSNIDKTAPTVPTLAADKTAPTNTNVTVTVTYPSDAAIKEYKIDSGAWTAYTTPVVMTANGTVYARATDAAGNVSTSGTLTVINIDKTPPTTPTLSASTSAPTKNNVNVTITFSGDSAVKEYRINGGAWTSYTAAVAMTANGLVEARATDAAGNISALGSLNVSNIDKVAPDAPTLVADKTAPTNTNVTVTITYPSDASIKQYRLNGGSWTTYTAPVAMSANGLIEAQATDVAGNVSALGSLTVSNIDKTAPTTPTLLADATAPTNGTVTVTVTYPGDAVLKEYRVNGGAWTAYSAPVGMIVNGTVDARATDAAGNVSALGSLTVSNIDKTAPVDATFTPDKTTPTNGNVNVTITYPADGVVKEYRINGGAWTSYSAPVVMTANGTVDARSTDAVGNVSNVTTYTVSNIDKVDPNAPTLAADKTAPTNGNVTITVTYPGDAAVKEYRVNDGAWTAYSSAVVMTANGTIDARATDSAGNVSNVTTLSVSNIDKSAPVDATFNADKTGATNTDVTVTITYPADGAVKEYRVNGGSWTAYSTPVVMSANGTVDARSTDSAGNVSNVITYTVSNIDKTAPVDATFSADKTAPTNGDVSVTITYPADGAVKEVRINGGAWTAYSATVVMTANGTIDARSTDSAGNVSNLTTYIVSNINNVAPTTPTISADKTDPTNTNVTVTITYLGGVSVKEYSVNGGAWTAYSSPVVMTANGTVEARATDSAGNVSNVATYNVSNIDKTAPTKPTAQVVGNQLTITSGTDASGIQKTEYQLNSGAWKTYTGVVSLPDGDYTINVKSIDTVGNESAITTITAQVTVQALANATAGVVQAETSKTQADVDSAQALVTALPASPEKNGLQVRLDQVKDEIVLSNQVSTIQNELDAMKVDVLDGNDTKAKLEGYEARLGELIDVVDALPSSVNKDPLYSEIGEIYDLIELIKSVFSLESTGGVDPVNLDDLQDKINQLPDGDLKDNLQNQLIDKLLQDATQAIESAEGSKSQSDVDKARGDVGKLPDGQNKTDLNNRLDEVQKQIDDAKALESAKQAVEKAESTKSQVDVDKARQEVVKLPDGQNKTELNTRLDEVQRQIDAEKAVQALQKAKDAVALVESTHKLEDYNNAYSLINALPNGSDKNALKARLDEVKRQMDAEANASQALANAIKQVKTAEKFHTSYNVDKAQQAIDVLPNSADKTALQVRLDEVKRQMADEVYRDQLVKATAKVVQLEQYKRDPYLTDAQTLVSALRDGADKTALQTRIDAVKAALALEAYQKQLAEATAAVVKAEGDKLQASVDAARTLVNALPNNSDKAALTARLDAIHVDPLSAADQVTADIDKVTNTTAKTNLSDLDKYVRLAEKYPSKANITNAINKLNSLSADVKTQYKTIVDNLAERCEILRVAFNRQLAIDSVASFEKYKLPTYKLQAQGAVDALPAGAEKDALQARINAVIMK